MFEYLYYCHKGQTHCRAARLKKHYMIIMKVQGQTQFLDCKFNF